MTKHGAGKFLNRRSISCFDNHCFGLFSIVWNYGGLIMPYIKDEDKTKFEDLPEIAGKHR